MKSPFPGMDPYLEKHWRDVHHSLCTYARDALQPQVRPAMVARLEERLVVETPGTERGIYPDVKVVERPSGPSMSASSAATAVLDEPLVVHVAKLADEQVTEGFIQIIDTSTGGRLVTVIEFLSTSNKVQGRGRGEYLQKQDELFHAGVSLVEIDLLRAGEWTLLVPPGAVPPEYREPYRACVHRGWKRGTFEVYRMPLGRRLPTIRIPLRQQDADAKLDLQALLDQTYANGAYDSIDYRLAPEPPLSPDLERLADDLLRGGGKR
jgi:hypothetical protein